MRLVTYLTAELAPRIGLVKEGEVYDLSSRLSGLSCMRQLIANAESDPQLISQAAAGALTRVGPLGQCRLAAPIQRPGKAVCIGLNYADHAAETGAPIPTEPVVFNKFPTSIVGPGAAIELPPISSQVDYEAELVVVIGKTARRIDRAQAWQHVFGYTCGHDVSARDWQKGRPGGQWLLGKTFDTFGPIGPTLVTADEVPNPHDLQVSFRLNGKTLQDSNTKQFIFQIDYLIAHLSQIFTLEPGDVIFTGTPPGVGVARTPPVFLKPGDLAEVEIGGLGVLANPVVAAPTN